MTRKPHTRLYYWYWAIKLNIFCWLAKREPDFSNYMQLRIWFGLVYESGAPKHCYQCGHDDFDKYDVYREDTGEVEYKMKCSKCTCTNGMWVYGTWQS